MVENEIDNMKEPNGYFTTIIFLVCINLPALSW